MKKKILKVLSTLLIGCSLFAVPASANTWRSFNDEFGNTYWNLYDDNGNLIKNQWYYENGEWYYLGSTGVMAWSACNGYYENGIITYTGVGCGYDINGQKYFFDNNGHMLHDCYIIYGGYVKSYIDNNGHIQ